MLGPGHGHVRLSPECWPSDVHGLAAPGPGEPERAEALEPAGGVGAAATVASACNDGRREL